MNTQVDMPADHEQAWDAEVEKTSNTPMESVRATPIIA